MISFASSLLLLQGVAQGREAPYMPIVWVSDKSSAVVSTLDAKELKSRWQDANQSIKLTSGNFGRVYSGYFIIVDKDVPMLKRMRERFLLSRRLVELADGKETTNGWMRIAGSELTESEQSELGEATAHWLGIPQTPAQLKTNDRLVFEFSQNVIFSSGSRKIGVQYQHPSSSRVADELALQKQPRAGLISESEEQAKEARQRRQSGLGETEMKDARIGISVFGLEVEQQDAASIQRAAVDVLEKLYTTQRDLYDKELNQKFSRVRARTPHLFPLSDASSLPEGEVEMLRVNAVRAMEENGYDHEEAKKAIATMTPSTPKLTITFFTGFESYGKPKTNFAAVVRIWP